MIVAESFLPHMHGVTQSVLRVAEQLSARGDEVVIVAPDGGGDAPGRAAALRQVPGEVIGLPAIAMPRYPEVRVAPGSFRRLQRLMERHAPDVVHLASPFILGFRAVNAAALLGLPSVAVYQTRIPGYAEPYGVPAIEAALWQHVLRLHSRATLTLAPSRGAFAELEALGVPRLRHWGRGVDTARFAPGHRDEAWRARLAPNGERLIGYVGRLAAEKQVEDLRVLAGLPGTRLVIIGDGPLRARLEQQLPGAHFTGFLGGDALAKAMAGLDLFVHPGEHETFCQTIQEAMASGVPVVATGAGGPLDLVDSSRTGWLYRPGDLAELRARVLDLVGDDGKRRAFALAAHESVQSRSWAAIGAQLIGHYREAIMLQTELVGAGAAAEAQR